MNFRKNFTGKKENYGKFWIQFDFRPKKLLPITLEKKLFVWYGSRCVCILKWTLQEFSRRFWFQFNDLSLSLSLSLSLFASNNEDEKMENPDHAYFEIMFAFPPPSRNQFRWWWWSLLLEHIWTIIHEDFLFRNEIFDEILMEFCFVFRFAYFEIRSRKKILKSSLNGVIHSTTQSIEFPKKNHYIFFWKN